MIREIVTIDEDLCNGCGECVPSCAEGAIQIIDGKARLVGDRLCDGLGACLGHCPQGAIKIERREAAAFDEAAAQRHVVSLNAHIGQPKPGNGRPTSVPATKNPAGPVHAGCPSSRFARFERSPSTANGGQAAGATPCCDARGTAQASELVHWPVQLRLLPPNAPVLHGARLLVAADCVPVAYAGFHSELLRDHAVVIACPKLDDPDGYVEKLAEMIRSNDLAEIMVARMEVPCCGGILQMVLAARQIAESNVPINDVIVSTRGEIMARQEILADSTGSGCSTSGCCPSVRS
ncbi:MAG: 4Fe-4S binding protein [Planctomycetes bacterium]|nr:4Fe-4S binding protein [Planctomycetota bacterium]